MYIELTDFQRNLLQGVIASRETASKNEQEAFKMVFSANGVDLPNSNINMRIEGSKLYWEVAEPKVTEPVVVSTEQVD